MTNKVNGWKKKALSMVGHMVLIKLLVQVIHAYLMQTFLVPKKIL